VNRLHHGQIIVGDVRRVLRKLPAGSVDTVITSPPYFRLRNYQRIAQIGLEAHVNEWVDELMLVARGLKRVLKPTGSYWLNLGDTFSRHASDGATTKSLVLAPERLALAMVNDGWVLRNKVVWAKANPMPTSVKDRLSCTYEVVYFFTREAHYFFDLDAIRIPHKGSSKTVTDAKRQPRTAWSVPHDWRGPSSGSNTGLDRFKALGLAGHPLGKNPGDVWTIPTAGYRGAHHAVYPNRLVERPLLATCPERVCAGCGTPWTRNRSTRVARLAVVHEPRQRCTCSQDIGTTPGIVLDPFMGSGTTAIVAEQHHREWVGIELNPEFAQLATKRITSARRAIDSRRTLTTKDTDPGQAAA